MSTFDMIKLWFIAKMMPLAIFLGIVAVLVVGCFAYAFGCAAFYWARKARGHVRKFFTRGTRGALEHGRRNHNV